MTINDTDPIEPAVLTVDHRFGGQRPAQASRQSDETCGDPVTERDMLNLLHNRFGKVYGNGRRYAVAEHVRSSTGWATRCADFLCMDLWESSGYQMQGFEVKISRSDWRAEMRDPHKAETFKRHVHRWWLVVPNIEIVRGDLPSGWGLLVQTESGVLRVKHRAPLLMPEPMPMPMLAAFLRAAVKTAERRQTVTTGYIPREAADAAGVEGEETPA